MSTTGKWFTYIITFVLGKNALKEILLPSFCRWGHWGSPRLGHLPTSSLLESSRTEFTPSLWNLKALYLYLPFYVWISAYFFFFFFCWAAPVAYGSSQAKGPTRAVANSLRHSNVESKSHLWPTPQLTAMPDPQPTDQGQGLNPQPYSS